MLHEIAPERLDNSFKYIEPQNQDYCISIVNGNIGTLASNNAYVEYPTYEQIGDQLEKTVYIFTIGGKNYFLCLPRKEEIEGLKYVSLKEFMPMKPKVEVYAGMCAYHLYVWYRDNQFCGRCGHKLVHDKNERMMRCTACNNQVFPKIMPAVIVAVVWEDKILVTRYKGRSHKEYALIAGFTEIGETAEETVAREVMEETGVKVKNIKYFATQPWGVAQDLLLGYFCELDGSPQVKIDEDELSWASWVSRDELEVEDHDISMTNRMLYLFSKGEC